jgi:hypothetical protein
MKCYTRPKGATRVLAHPVKSTLEIMMLKHAFHAMFMQVTLV